MQSTRRCAANPGKRFAQDLVTLGDIQPFAIIHYGRWEFQGWQSRTPARYCCLTVH